MPAGVRMGARWSFLETPSSFPGHSDLVRGTVPSVTSTPSRRTVLRATAWTAPAVAVAAAAPAYAASVATVVTGTLVSTRNPDDVTVTGTVTNLGTTPVMVTLTITIEADSEQATGGSGNLNGWAYVAFDFTASGRGVRFIGTREITGGQTVPAPQITADFAQTASGTSTMTITTPSPATATSPAPVPFTAYASTARQSTTPTSPALRDFSLER